MRLMNDVYFGVLDIRGVHGLVYTSENVRGSEYTRHSDEP
jgi:hypothetical protein